MTDSTYDAEDSSAALDEALAGALRQLESGADRESILAAFPDFATEIARYLDDREHFERAINPGQTAAVPVPPGMVIGDFKLISELDRGGMGIVYRARQISLNRPVAVKMILRDHHMNANAIRRFREEAELAAKLQHPGIVAIHEVGEHDGLPYFSMDLVEGTSLSEIARQAPLPAQVAARYTRDVARAVDHAHQRGVLHRDLKPSNVLIDEHDDVRVSDFGLAKRVDSDSNLTRSGQVMGTASYMSPEQARGKNEPVGPASDVYSLGCILYELLTARPPFRGETTIETLRQVRDDEVLAPSRLNPRVPRDLETVCLKCLEKLPERRYSTAAGLADDLDRFLAGRPVVARRIGRLETAWRWCSRNPAIALWASAAVVLLVTTAIASTAGFILMGRHGTAVTDRQIALVEADLQRARRLSREGEYRAAIRLYTTIIDQRPGVASLFVERCRGYYDLGSFGPAIEDAQRAIQLDGLNPEARLMLVLAAFELKQHELVQRESDWFERHGGETAAAAVVAAVAQPATQEAATAISAVVDQDPTNPLWHYLRGAILYERVLRTGDKRDFDLGTADLERTLTSRPRNRRAAFRLARYYLLFGELGDVDDDPDRRAGQLLDDWLTAEPHNTRALVLRAIRHRNHREFTPAVNVCRRGLAREPYQPDLTFILADTHRLAGNHDSAAEAYSAIRDEDVSRFVILPPSKLQVTIGALENTFQNGKGRASQRSKEAQIEIDRIRSEFPPEQWTVLDCRSFAAVLSGTPLDRFLEAWIDRAPRCGMAHALLAESLENYKTPSDDERRAVMRLAPRFAELYRLRAEDRASSKSSHTLSQVADDYRTYLRLAFDPADYDIAHFFAYAPVNHRDYALAARIALRGVEQDSNAKWVILLAEARRRNGQFDAGRQALDEFLKKRPDAYTVILARANLAYETGDFAAAERDYTQWLDGLPFKDAHARLAKELVVRPDLPEAWHTWAFDLQKINAVTRDPWVVGAVQLRLGQWEAAERALVRGTTTVAQHNDAAASLFWALVCHHRNDEASAQRHYLSASQWIAHQPATDLNALRDEIASLLGIRRGADDTVREVIRLGVGAGDWPQWGGTSHRNNVPEAEGIPARWEIGTFNRRTATWDKTLRSNVKWIADLGSQTYGSPVIANGRIFVGTNNGAKYIKRYQGDLGCMLCFREDDGEFLWQYSSEKLASGRVNDWPQQGIVSTPLVEGDRMWFVSNRCEVVCLDTEGVYDDEDDGDDKLDWATLFRTPVTTIAALDARQLPDQLRSAIVGLGLPFDGRLVTVNRTGQSWTVDRYESTSRGSRRVPAYDLVLQGDRIAVFAHEPGKALVDSQRLADFPVPLVPPPDDGDTLEHLRSPLSDHGVTIEPQAKLIPTDDASTFTCVLRQHGAPVPIRISFVNGWVHVEQKLTVNSRHEADVVWKLDMMDELGVFPHNLATCAVTGWEDYLFVCTSNGVDETHLEVVVPRAPSFLCIDKRTGKVLWEDASPGNEILHGQWSAPAVGLLAGIPQVVFCGGDGWVYSFRADRWNEETRDPILLWKFDVNSKESKWGIYGRTNRNSIIAIPVIYDGLVYVVVGQDPEHGEGDGHLWCIDPGRSGDVSLELAVYAADRNRLVPRRRGQAVQAEAGEMAIANPNSAVVWHFSKQDFDGDGDIDGDEVFHRSLGSPVIKDDVLYVADTYGLFHCFDAKTGQRFWTYDLFAAVWGSPLVVDGKVFIGDEDGDVEVFRHVPRRDAVSGRPPLMETNVMHSSVYSSPVVANGVLYITDRSRLYAIEQD